ncbi:hypothetical protein Tco_0174305 [Tanacetum coccineum]
MDEVDIEDLTIEQYLRLTQESQTPKKIEDMTIADTPSHDPIREFSHYFDPNQPSAESDCDSEDMEEGVEYMTDDEVVMSEQEESNHGYTQNIKHFEEKDDIDEWLNAEITKHMSMQGVENMKDALISIINNEVDRTDDNTPNTAPCRLTKELSPGSFLLPFNINSHNLYATATLDAKDNFMPQRVYEYLEFSCNFVIKMAGDVIILGRPFLESTRAQIDVFNEEISFEIGSKKFKFNIDSYQSMEKIYMVDIAQEEETFNPLEIGIDLFSYESPACLEFEQRIRSHGTHNPHDEIAKPISFSPDRRGLVKRWHVCKPVHVTYGDGSGEDCGMWPTCDPDSKFCFGYNEVFGNIDDTTRERRIGHNNLHESDREFIFNERILDSYDVEEEYAREIGDPYSRRFNEYNRVFNNEFEHLSNEYILRIRKKGYVLDDVWEKCQQHYKKTNEAWHDEAYEEDEMCFICITDREDEALPLGRMNGARFKDMIRKELEGKALTRLNSSTWATKWFKRLVAYAKCNRDSYESELGDKELARRRK